MFRFRTFAIILLILISSIVSNGQDDAETLKLKQDKEIKLLEEILVDANNLRLSENRALVYAEVGNKIWQADPKKGLTLFELSIDELIKTQNDATLDTKKKENLRNLIYGQQPRRNILYLIANHDAEFALDALVKTRPSKLLEALGLFYQKQQTEGSPFSSGYRYSSTEGYARSEIEIEQRFISMAAKQNPERMAELFRNSLKKGISYQTYQMLSQIHSKDPVIANTLAEEAVDTLLKLEIYKDGRNLSNFTYFLNTFGRIESTDTKSLKISNASIRNIADKILTYWLNPYHNSNNINQQSLKIIEKLFPSRANALKKKNVQNNKQFQKQNDENKRYKELIESNPTGAELLVQAKNFSGYRSSIYNSAINKLTQEGNVAQVIDIVKSNFPKEEANRRLSQIYTNLASQEVSKGNYESAISYINEIPNEESRFNPMVNLASSIFQKDREKNKEYALSILQQLDSLIDPDPKTSNELTKIVYLANTYAQIEPSQAFTLLETVIKPLNEYSKALTLTSQFRNDGRVRDGEILISMGTIGTGQFNLIYTFQTLKLTDFSQTMQLINRFEQKEVRIALKLKLINNIGNSQIMNLPVNPTRFSNVLTK